MTEKRRLAIAAAAMKQRIVTLSRVRELWPDATARASLVLTAMVATIVAFPDGPRGFDGGSRQPQNN
jgi:hypothetical protein